jgi:hypothetical protein
MAVRSGRALAAVAGMVVVLWSGTALAITFGPKNAIEIRGKVYTQYTVATEESQEYTQPDINPGDMKQWRTFYNPELEVDFRSLIGAQGWVDELEGRAAVWGFYDAIYDLGPERYAQNLGRTKQTKNTLGNDATTAFYSWGHSVAAALQNRGQRRDGREFYGRRVRVNEAYVDVAKGPFFARIGKQAISWGEADTVGLLDANNPFDVLIQPGLQIDLDEARIPLWTIRSTYELFSTLGPLSSGFLEAYWVPGWLDVETGFLNIQGVSPYSQPPPIQGPAIQVYQLLPQYGLENSRWGAKFQTVINRDYNLSVWFYRAFNLVPIPVLAGISQEVSPGVPGYVTSVTNQKLNNVWGAAMSWYSDILSSIVRTELELFQDEASFLAYKAIGSVVASGFQTPGRFQGANVLRGELGVDYNFFLPLLNPSSSFLMVSSIVFEANLDETDNKDFRVPIIKPSAIERELAGGLTAGQNAGPSCDNKNTPPPDQPGLSRCDFVNQDPIEAFMQATVRSDFMHGRLTPQLTTIGTFRGALTFAPSVVYRFNDNMLFDVKYINTHTFGSGDNGYTKGVGLNRDRDQFWVRATFQLN